MRAPTRPLRVNHLGYYTRNARQTVQFWTEVMRCKFTSSAEQALDQWEAWRDEAVAGGRAFGEFLRHKLSMRAKHVA